MSTEPFKQLHLLQWLDYADQIKSDGQIKALAENGTISHDLSAQATATATPTSFPKHDPAIVVDGNMPYPPYIIHALRQENGLGYTNVGEYYYTVPVQPDRSLDLYNYWHALYDNGMPLHYHTWLRLEGIKPDKRALGGIPRSCIAPSPYSPGSRIFEEAKRVYRSTYGLIQPELKLRIWEDISIAIAAEHDDTSTTTDLDSFRCPAFEMERRVRQLTLSFVCAAAFVKSHRQRLQSASRAHLECVEAACAKTVRSVVTWWELQRGRWDELYGFTETKLDLAKKRYLSSEEAMKQLSKEMSLRLRQQPPPPSLEIVERNEDELIDECAL